MKVFDDEINIKKINESFESWLNKPYISEDLKENLSNSNLLFIPEESFRDYDGPIFPKGTLDLLLYVQNNCQGEIYPEICIEDEDYKELALHNNYIWLATVILQQAVVPFFISLLANYISSRYNIQQNNHVEIDIIMENDEDYKKIEFKGDAKNLFKILDKIDKMDE